MNIGASVKYRSNIIMDKERTNQRYCRISLICFCTKVSALNGIEQMQCKTFCAKEICPNFKQISSVEPL